MNTGETGIVKQVNQHAPLAPVVLLVKAEGNTLLSSPCERNLSAQVETPHCTITAILDPHHTGTDPTLYLDKKAA